MNKEQIQKSDFKKIRFIGSGAFGEVLLVKKAPETKLYAMKRLDKKFIDKVSLNNKKCYIFEHFYNKYSKAKIITSFWKN